MNCDEIITEIYTYLDGEVHGVRRARVEWHLRHCGGCSGAFRFEERLLKLVSRSCQGDDIPVELFERLRALIDQEAQEPGTDAAV